MRDGFRVFDSDTHLSPSVESVREYFDSSLKAREAELAEFKRPIKIGRAGQILEEPFRHWYRFPAKAGADGWGGGREPRHLGEAGPRVNESRRFQTFMGQRHPKVGAEDFDVAARVQEMDEEGVDTQLLVTSPFGGHDDPAVRAGLPRFMTIEGTGGSIVTGPGPQNVLRSLVSGSRLDYEKKIDTRSEAGAEVPVSYYYETEPRIEAQNPFADRLLDEKDNPWVGDSIARAAELDSLHRAVTEGAAPQYGMDKARRDVELSIIIIESARSGKRMKARLDPEQETPWEREQREAVLN